MDGLVPNSVMPQRLIVHGTVPVFIESGALQSAPSCFISSEQWKNRLFI